ncbi:MAG: GNAT family N-acetyltransferase [Alphaproteobacteria bacterium]
MNGEAPQPLTAHHDCSGFDSGQPVLDEWLRNTAARNEASGASRTYVICDGAKVLAYYCLANGAVTHAASPGKIRRNMPDPIPVMILGRLAVDSSLHARGIGRGLLKDAILRTLNASEIAGIRAMLVHAINEDAARFYRHNGFLESPSDSLLLMLPLDTIRKALG